MPETVRTESQYRADSQPPPIPNQRRAIADLVIAAINARREYGIAEYGTPLQSFNGRDALTDAFEEAIDLSLYLCQAIDERDNPLPVAPPVSEQEIRERLAAEIDRVGAEAPLFTTRKGFAFAAAIVRGVPASLDDEICERCNRRTDRPREHWQTQCDTTRAMNIIEFHYCCPGDCKLKGKSHV